MFDGLHFDNIRANTLIKLLVVVNSQPSVEKLFFLSRQLAIDRL